ncbi:MAG TPA: VWA domain-containing protein [Candidatus Acidoferrales bacterium]|nr:VWA domain-containing protein [Candidatus Acidoferrales bacterium]
MRPIIATLLSALMALPALPQQAQAPAPAAPKPVARFSATSQLVIVDVTLKDKSGNPAKGLKASDFLVTEDGKKQDVKICEYQELEETIAPPAPVPSKKAQPVVAAVAPAAVPAAAAQPQVKSLTANQIAPSRPGEVKYKDRRLLVMFFDMTSMPIQDQIRAQTAAEKFLKTQMQPADLMAIMTFSSDLDVKQDFTDDKDALQKTIKSLIIGEGSDLAVLGSTGADNEEDTGAAYTADDTEFNIFNTDRKLAALETAARMLGSLPEKKALVYFASGVSKTGVENEAQLRATVNAAIRNNVSFFPIDARGLVASAPLGDATKASPGGAGMYSGSSARSQQSQFQDQQETLYTLAADTGGKALLDNNDLALGIQQAQKEISSYYILGYYSSNEKLDGRYRKIKVELNPQLASRYGKPDHRPGYFAGKEFGKFTSSDKERQLAEALMLGDPMTDLSVALEVDYFRLARDRYFVPVTVKIPGSELELAKSGGAEMTKLDFIGEVRDAKGAVQGNVRDAQDIKLKGDNAGQLSKRTLAYDTGFTLPPGTYTLKFLARENQTGKMGTFETKFVIPDLTTEIKHVPISSVVLSNQRMDMSQSLATAEKDKRLLSQNPLIEGNQKLIPSVTRVFKKDQDMYVFLHAYEPDAQTTQPLVASVSFYRGKVKAFETAPLQVKDGLDPKSKALPVRFSVPLGKLQPGRYTCQVSILDPQGQKFSFWRAPIVMLP